MSELVLNRNQYLEAEKIGLGAFAPLTGFMTEDQVRGVAQDMRLPSGDVFTIPVVLDLQPDETSRLKGLARIALIFEGIEAAEFQPQDFFTPDKAELAQQVFGTVDPAHPGVAHLMSMGPVFAGGAVTLKERAPLDISDFEMTPAETKALFRDRGWTSVVGFQTRNVPHRAHEYLHRVALETSDGLFIQPIVGRKKVGDYTPAAIIRGYQTLLQEFLPSDRVVFGILSTSMRYAGPREAIFHAMIRRNYGCTKFIVGRDHAGVGDYYGMYDAHDLTRELEGELGIEILRLHGPYYCRRCDGIVTERTCPHRDTDPSSVQDISGTGMRAILAGGAVLEPHLMRPEIVSSLRDVRLFVEEKDL